MKRITAYTLIILPIVILAIKWKSVDGLFLPACAVAFLIEKYETYRYGRKKENERV